MMGHLKRGGGSSCCKEVRLQDVAFELWSGVRCVCVCIGICVCESCHKDEEEEENANRTCDKNT